MLFVAKFKYGITENLSGFSFSSFQNYRRKQKGSISGITWYQGHHTTVVQVRKNGLMTVDKTFKIDDLIQILNNIVYFGVVGSII